MTGDPEVIKSDGQLFGTQHEHEVAAPEPTVSDQDRLRMQGFVLGGIEKSPTFGFRVMLASGIFAEGGPWSLTDDQLLALANEAYFSLGVEEPVGVEMNQPAQTQHQS